MITQSHDSSGNEKRNERLFLGQAIVTLGLEIFVSVMIVVVIIAMLLPFLAEEEGVSTRTQSLNNLHQIGIAMHDYANNHKTFPPAVVYDQHGKPLYSWRVLLLPYLEEQALFAQFKLDEPWDSPNNKQLLEQIPHVYITQWQRDVKEPYSTHYQVFTGGGAMFEADPQSPPLSLKQIASADGTGKTLMVVEAAEPVPWSKPQDLPYSPDQSLPRLGGLFHKKGFNVLMADGSGRWFSPDLDEKTIRAMITWNGGEQVKWPE